MMSKKEITEMKYPEWLVFSTLCEKVGANFLNTEDLKKALKERADALAEEAKKSIEVIDHHVALVEKIENGAFK